MDENRQKQIGRDVQTYFQTNKIKQTQVAAKLGITSGALSGILNGYYNISNNVAKKLCDIYPFNYNYLVFGEGGLILTQPATAGNTPQTNEQTPDKETYYLTIIQQQQETITRLTRIIETLTKQK